MLTLRFVCTALRLSCGCLFTVFLPGLVCFPWRKTEKYSRNGPGDLVRAADERGESTIRGAGVLQAVLAFPYTGASILIELHAKRATSYLSFSKKCADLELSSRSLLVGLFFPRRSLGNCNCTGRLKEWGTRYVFAPREGWLRLYGRPFL